MCWWSRKCRKQIRFVRCDVEIFSLSWKMRFVKIFVYVFSQLVIIVRVVMGEGTVRRWKSCYVVINGSVCNGIFNAPLSVSTTNLNSEYIKLYQDFEITSNKDAPRERQTKISPNNTSLSAVI